jgi:predicted Zn finger-like uncharacterized protein
MSLATTCTACGTVFRVVQDQLKVSEGWVRCGRCDEIFNALEGLFDLDRDTAPGSLPADLDPPRSSVPPARGAPEAWTQDLADAQRAPGAVVPHAAIPPRQDQSLAERLGSELFPQRHGSAAAGVNSRLTPFEREAHGESRHDSEFTGDDGMASRPIDSDLRFEDSVPLQTSVSGAPEFLRHAERLARWHRPWVRMLLSMALLLLATLALQTAQHWRNTIAARWPDALPLLVQWCELVSCSIEPPQRIDDIGLESSGFTRVAGVDQFRLSIVLRNRGATRLAMPWVELSLTDASGNLLVRRVLSPQDFRVPSPVLAANGEAALQLLLATGTPLVTGYTVEIFYP